MLKRIGCAPANGANRGVFERRQIVDGSREKKEGNELVSNTNQLDSNTNQLTTDCSQLKTLKKE
jgi:X-X-X-Leu-X-X-Gly heptad repeat protein